MMSQRSRRELLVAVQPRYLQASRKGKTQILDEFVASTGYHRKHAVRLLNKGLPRGLQKRRGRRKTYQGAVVIALTRIWEICGRICSKRLLPFLPEMVAVLERCGEMQLEPDVKELLLNMSRSTIDRCLRSARFEQRKGLATTKPGHLLKKAIPVRTFADWDDARPGFLEVDLVAHCGETTAGQYLNTLTAVDIATGWVECLPLLHRSQSLVLAAIGSLRSRLPFDLLGLDCDNGGEFINDMLYRYCLAEQITFTRSRPYKKNDQAHVEQKNGSVVRNLIGYDRFETQLELALLDAIYLDLRLYANFFQPVLKLVSKERVGNSVKKQYDQAATPYQRVLNSPEVTLAVKAGLMHLYLQLNPVSLRDRIDENVARLWKLVR